MAYLKEHHLASTDGMVYEHIIIAEQILGRYLKLGEEVHHEDRNRANNTKENLFVFKTKSDHARYHQNNVMILAEDGSYTSPEIVKYSNCKVCGNLFINIWNTSHCNVVCSGSSNRLVDRPTKERLEILLRGGSFVSVGKIFSVSDNAVRKWCESYGMSRKSKDYKLD